MAIYVKTAIETLKEKVLIL